MSLVAGLIIATMIVLNAVFAAYEIALASISVARLKALADEHRSGARAALDMKQSMEASLAVVQLGITLVGAIAAATGGAGAMESLLPWFTQLGFSRWLAEFVSVALVVVPLSALTIIAGELMPKLFALQNKEWICLKISPTMKLLAAVAYPAVWVLEAASSRLTDWIQVIWQRSLGHGHRIEISEMQELRAVVALARTSRLIGLQEEKIILGAARLSDRKVAEIMIPAEEIISLDLDHSMSEALVIAHTDMHTRFPVCRQPGDPQTICGYVNFKDIVSELRLAPNQPSLAGILRRMPELEFDLTIAGSLERLIRGHVHIALVRDRTGQVAGMITLEDILEELVGDIRDEYDRLPGHVVISGTGWVMGGGVTLERVESVAGVRLDRSMLDSHNRTLHDWVEKHLEHAVRGGDLVIDSGLRVVVRKVRRQLMMEAQVTPDRSAAPSAAAESNGTAAHSTAPHGTSTASPARG